MNTYLKKRNKELIENKKGSLYVPSLANLDALADLDALAELKKKLNE